MSSTDRYLTALFGDQRGSVELRWRTDSGMCRAFYGVNRLQDVATKIAQLAPTTDIYVGVLPRRRQASTRDDIATHGSVLWVDCDTPAAVAALQHKPRPSILMQSGTGHNLHAYWLLSEPISIDLIEAANRALAQELGADIASTDPARILRPPSLNHKHDPPTDVQLVHCDPASRYNVADIVGSLPVEVSARHASRPRGTTDDPLADIEPHIYVERLTGITFPRTGKIRCPFHKDDTPSLHVYRDPARGWYCYGCRRGGSIYDFAAARWGMATRGDDFIELRRRLDLLFDHIDLGTL